MFKIHVQTQFVGFLNGLHSCILQLYIEITHYVKFTVLKNTAHQQINTHNSNNIHCQIY